MAIIGHARVSTDAKALMLKMQRSRLLTVSEYFGRRYPVPKAIGKSCGKRLLRSALAIRCESVGSIALLVQLGIC
jgi:hypothetical protein